MSAEKLDSGKPKWSLLPGDALVEVIGAYEVGVRKYGRNDWMAGMAYDRLFDAMMRHAWAWWGGETRDAEGHHHLGAVCFCALTLIWYQMRGRGTDTRPGTAEAASKDAVSPRVVFAHKDAGHSFEDARHEP